VAKILRCGEDTEMWQRLEINTEERKEEEKCTKGIKERKKEGEGLEYERNQSR
jgi:hypothetical protein